MNHRPKLYPLFADTFRSEPVAWRTRLSLDVVEQALSDVGLTGWISDRRRPLRGRIGKQHVVAVRRTMINNSWRPMFFGTLRDTGHGTELHGVIRTHRFAMWLFPVWIGIATVLTISLAIASLTNGRPIGLVALAFPLMGSLMCHFGAWLARDEWSFLRTQLRTAIDGEEIDPNDQTDRQQDR